MGRTILNRRHLKQPKKVGFLPWQPWTPPEPVSTVPGKVSIIVPAYMAQRTLYGALMSCHWQTRLPDEVVVVDDGSKDHTSYIAGDYALSHSNVKVARLPVNRGAAAARNYAIRLACGEFIIYLDADDCLPPTRIEQALDEFAATGAEVIYGQKEMWARDWRIRQRGRTVQPPAPVNIIGGTGFSTAALSVRRSVHVERGIWMDESMKVAEDAELLVACLSAGVSVHCSSSVVVWRRENERSLTDEGDWALMRQWVRTKHIDWLRGYMGNSIQSEADGREALLKLRKAAGWGAE